MPNMKLFKSKNTNIECMVRKPLFFRGLRYRLHYRTLPGSPDLVFPKYNAVIFINGCFWHGHEECSISHFPKKNKLFWSDKIRRNKMRDERNLAEIEKMGWRVLIVWECSIKSKAVDFHDIIDYIECWVKGRALSTQMTEKIPMPTLFF